MDPVPFATDRRTARRAVRARCHAVAERGFRFLGDWTEDLSDRGLLLPTDHPVHVGERVLLSLEAPGTRCWVDVEARVVRVVAGRRAADRRRSVALAFERVDRPGRAVLRASLRGLPPPMPTRACRRDYVATLAPAGRGR